MNPKRPPVALRQDLEVATRLRGLDEAERVLLPGDLQIAGIVTRHLQEDAGVGTTFIALSCGVQEARPEAEARRDPLVVAHTMACSLKQGLVRGVHLDVRKEREVVACDKPAKMGPQVRRE